jgi:tellurite resistance protein TerC
MIISGELPKCLVRRDFLGRESGAAEVDHARSVPNSCPILTSLALDSIPAIYGLTEEPYLVFTANVFALMGLRQLYFLIGGLLRKLVYLSIGLSVILAFIGVKLVLEALHGYHVADWAPFDGEIPIWFSLTFIIGTLLFTTVASLIKSRYDEDSADATPSGQPASADKPELEPVDAVDR